VTVIPDIPVGAVFLVLFAACAAANMYHLKTNQSNGYKFFFNGPMFGKLDPMPHPTSQT
jgi:hypothetical protein